MAFQKIGVFAGVFDPFHTGHLKFIDEVIEKYGLDKVLIVIEEEPKFKKTFARFEHRKKIVELSTKDAPGVEIYDSLSDSFPLSSTLPKIKSEFNGEIYLLIGDDVKKHIRGWPGSEDLLKDVKLVVADRNEDGHKRVSSGKVRQQIKTAGNVDITKDALDYCRRTGLYK